MVAWPTCPRLIGRTERVWSEVGLPAWPGRSHANEFSARNIGQHAVCTS